jgi:hypothetical protein
MIIGSLLPLIVVLGIGYLIVTRIRRTTSGSATRDTSGGVRRVFQYLGAFIALIVSTTGVASLLERALDEGGAEDMAGTLAMVVVGVPTFVFLARWIWIQLVTSPTERNSTGWTFYLNLTLVTTLATAAGSVIAAAVSAIDDGDLDARAVAQAVVWGGVWVLHWLAWRRVTPGQLPRVHLWIASIAGLGMMAGASGYLLYELFDELLASAMSVSAADGEAVVAGIVIGTIGAAIWAWHWLVNARPATESPGWSFTVMVVGVLGGLLTFLIGAATSVFLVLQWWWGDPEATTAGRHFVDLAGPLAAIVVGSAVWWYHRLVIGPDRARTRTEMDRTYDYLLTGVSVATVAAGITMLLLALIDAIAGDDASRAGVSEADGVLTAITMVLVGLPLWLVTWRRISGLVARDRDVELASPARRTFLFTMFGVAGAVAFGALIRLAVVIFEMLLDERASTTAADLRVPVALLVTTGAVAAYHWVVYRTERTITVRRERRDVLLVCTDDLDYDRIASEAHVRVRVLHRTDGVATADTETVIGAIESADGDDLLVIADAEGVRIVPCASV